MKTIAFQMDNERLYDTLKKFMDTKGIKLKELGTRAIEHAVEIIEAMDMEKRQEIPTTSEAKESAKRAFMKELGLLKNLSPEIMSETQKEEVEPETSEESDEFIAEPETSEESDEFIEEPETSEESDEFIAEPETSEEPKEFIEELESSKEPEEFIEESEEPGVSEASEEPENSESKVKAWDCESTKEAIVNFIMDNKRIPSQKEFKQNNGLPSYKCAKRSLGRSPAEYCHECYDDLKKQGYIEQEPEEENNMGMSL